MRAQEAWRLPAAYRYSLDLDGQGLAWEFLRRNPTFRDEIAGPLAAAPASPPATIHRSPHKVTISSSRLPWLAPRDPAARWGLTFRSGPCAPG